MVLLLLVHIQGSSGSRPCLRDGLCQNIEVDFGSREDVIVGNKFVEPSLYLFAPTIVKLCPCYERSTFIAYLVHDCRVWLAVKLKGVLSLLDKRLYAGDLVRWCGLEEGVLPHGLHNRFPSALICRDVMQRVKCARQDDLEFIIHIYVTMFGEITKGRCEPAGKCIGPPGVIDFQRLL